MADDEQQQKRTTRRRRKADDAPEAGAEVEDEEVEADEQAPPPAPKPARRSAATHDRPELPRDARGQVAVRARAKYVRSAPRKARLVMDNIRGKHVTEARAILQHTSRGVSTDVLKLLNSAIANAENNFELGADELKVGLAYVDEGPTIKRYRPRALGRATRINKRTSHMTITLTTLEKR